MKFQAKVTDVTKIEADLLAVFAGSEEPEEGRWGGGVRRRTGDILFLHSHGNIPAKWVAIVGLEKFRS